MRLTWRPGGGSGIAANLYGFTPDERLVAQVVRYDEPPGWKAFVRGYPVGGRWDEMRSAQRVAENHVT